MKSYIVKYRKPDGWRARGYFRRGRQGWTNWETWASFRFMFEAVACAEHEILDSHPNYDVAIFYSGKRL